MTQELTDAQAYYAALPDQIIKNLANGLHRHLVENGLPESALIVAELIARMRVPVGLCQTCKHFLPTEREDAPFGKCGQWETGYGDKTPDLNGALVESDEGWAMVLGPDFGCVRHEPADGVT